MLTKSIQPIANAPADFFVSDQIKMTIPNFNVAFVIKNFGCCDLKFYSGLIHNASKDDLISLRQEIKLHRKKNRQDQAFSNVQNFSTHNALISAINHELLKRLWYYPLYRLLLRLRIPIVKVFTGLELKEDEHFGTLYTQPEYLRHYYLHMPHNAFLPMVGRFILGNLKFIIGTILTILGCYLAYLQLIKTK